MEPQANQCNQRNAALEQLVYSLSSQQVPDSVLGPHTGYVIEFCRAVPHALKEIQ